MKHVLLPAMATSLLLFAACNKESTTVAPGGSSTTQPTLTYELRAVNASTTFNQKSTAGGMLVWNSGYAYPKEIKFEAKTEDTKIEYKSKNTDRIDLFAPSPIGFGGFVLPAGTYKEIELKIKLDDNGSDPAMVLNGTYSDQLGSIPVVFIVEDAVELKTEVKDVTITDGSFAALTTLDLATATGGISESKFRNAQLTNGTLIISRNSNRNLYDAIVKNLMNKRHKCEYKHK